MSLETSCDLQGLDAVLTFQALQNNPTTRPIVRLRLCAVLVSQSRYRNGTVRIPIHDVLSRAQ